LEQNIQNTHGQCVAWGMIFACLISKSDKLLDQDEAEEIIENLLDLYPLPSLLPKWNNLEKYLLQDKKNQSGKLQFTLIKAIGKGIIQQSKSLSEVEPLWNTFTALK
jgi:3-dehydroquinate synthase